uniref:BPTI/Kunitz inhibitor domain-containing protein n=1 Tax=Pseudonaja textilis TaxID=8673 RepID=A0A670Z9Z8_PSETE
PKSNLVVFCILVSWVILPLFLTTHTQTHMLLTTHIQTHMHGYFSLRKPRSRSPPQNKLRWEVLFPNCSLCLPGERKRRGTFPPDPLKRFFYNATSKSCQFFIDYGCSGSLNSYLSAKECEEACKNIGESSCCSGGRRA